MDMALFSWMDLSGYGLFMFCSAAGFEIFCYYFLPNRGICIYTISVVKTLITNNVMTRQAHNRWYGMKEIKKFEFYANCLIVMTTVCILISHGIFVFWT